MQRQHFNHIYLADVKHNTVVWLNIQIFSKCQLNTIPFHPIPFYSIACNEYEKKKELDESASLIQINSNLSKYDYFYMYTIRVGPNVTTWMCEMFSVECAALWCVLCLLCFDEPSFSINTQQHARNYYLCLVAEAR